MTHVNRIKDTYVFFFGSTSGIGYAVAYMALSNGAHSTISGSAQPKVDNKASQFRSLYSNLPASNVSGLACDLTDIKVLDSNLGALFDKATEGGSKKIDHIAPTAGDSITPDVCWMDLTSVSSHQASFPSF